MHIKTGIDLIEDSRIEKNLVNKNFLKRVFHPSELRYAKENAKTKKEQAKKLAGIFAIKEATSKALNIIPPKWLEIEVAHNSQGKPTAKLSNLLQKKIKLLSIDASLSHAKGLTTCIVTILKR